MTASIWRSAIEVAYGVIALIVLALIKTVLALRERLARLEARDELRSGNDPPP